MVTGIGHVAFRITDLDSTLDFYCGKLGFREAFRLDREGEASPWIVYLQIAPGHFIELFPGAAGSPAQSDAGYNHYCLVVDDLPDTLRALAQRGLDVPGEPQLGLDGNLQYWLKDPDGNRIELMQIMPGSLHDQADRSAPAVAS